MVAEIYAGLSSLKIAFDLAKGLKDIDDATRRNAAVIELQEKILSAQAAQSELVEAISTLKKRVAELEAWETEKQRYQLAEIASGIVCYEPKEGMRDGEPPHRLCANCYAAGQKRFLQAVQNGPSFYRFRCNACGEEVHYSRGGNPPVNRYKPVDF
ncbi:hypothetical protein [Methylocystis sp.]|uniref:hypothetical protein n=1 Tax=Methylocystis sp. TaxID=1911079 RepID=UPI003DA389AE